jgi:hypothetical protein
MFLSGVELDMNGSFVDYFEPDAVFVLHVQPEVAPGTLLAENAQAAESLQIKLRAAELLFAKGKGTWDFGEFKAKVVGKVPLLVIVEFAGGVCGGFAAVPFEDAGYTADPTGASFVFSLQPTVARYPLKDKAEAIYLGLSGGGSIWFGDCLAIYSDGDMKRCEGRYAVPSDWWPGGTAHFVKFTRFEVWHVTS